MGPKLAVLAGAHVVALIVLHTLLATFEPEPNGFRFDSWSKGAAIAASLAPPALISTIAASRNAVLACALVHAASPLLLLGNMQNPDADLNLAVLWWWFPLPVLLGAVAVADRLRMRRRR